MKRTNLTRSKYLNVAATKQSNPALRALVLGLALAGCGAQAQAAVATTYTFTDLNTVPITGTSINNSGVIPGSGSAPSVAYDSASGILSDIGTNSSGVTIAATGRMNNAGQVLQTTPTTYRVGLRNYVFYTPVVRNPDGTAVVTQIPLTGNATTNAITLNDNGKVLLVWGTAEYLWSATGGAQLLPLTGNSSMMLSLNNQDQMVGYIGGMGTGGVYTHAAFSTLAGAFNDLHSAGMVADSSSTANAINDNGIAVGSATFSGSPSLTHGVIWDTTTGKTTEIGVSGSHSQLMDINASGQFIGEQIPEFVIDPDMGTPMYSNFGDQANSRAVIGNISGGGLTDLNTLVSGLPATVNIYSAIDINDAGQILVDTWDSNTWVSSQYLLTPTKKTCSGTGTITNYPVSKVYLQLTDGTKVGFTAMPASTTFTGGTTNFSNGEIITYSGTLDAATMICAATSMTVAPAVITTPATPIAPSNLISNAKTNKQVVLSWFDNATNELNYLIERCKGTGCTNFNQVAKVGANVKTYSDTNLRRNTSYNYRVRALTRAVNRLIATL